MGNPNSDARREHSRAERRIANRLARDVRKEKEWEIWYRLAVPDSENYIDSQEPFIGSLEEAEAHAERVIADKYGASGGEWTKYDEEDLVMVSGREFDPVGEYSFISASINDYNKSGIMYGTYDDQ